MKKTILCLGISSLCLTFQPTLYAATSPKPGTENTESRSKLGEVVDNTAAAVKKGAHKTKVGVKTAAHKTGEAIKHGVQKTEEIADRSVEKPHGFLYRMFHPSTWGNKG